MKKQTQLLSFLNKRLSQAKRFTEEHFINEVKQNIKDYDAQPVSASEILSQTNSARALQMAQNSRYETIRPVIFVNTEAAKSEIFDRTPDLVLSGRGAEDHNKKVKIEAVYNYLRDLLDLDGFAWEAGHWFVLSGFTSASIGYKIETHQEPVIDPETGEALLDEEGEPVMQEAIDYDDPTICVDNPLKTYYAPSSEFTVDGQKVPYRISCQPISVHEVKKLYKDVKDIDELKGNYVEEYDDDDKDDEPDKLMLNYYEGVVPEEYKELVDEWKGNCVYKITFTSQKVLDVEKLQKREYRLGRWYSHPNKFFGYGFGRIGAPFQKEKSIRVGQRIRLADIAAYPKWAVKNDGKNKIDPSALKDPRENILISYETEAPSVLAPGNLSGVVTEAEQSADADAQAAFGLLDISTGAQEATTVKTATGQTIFAEAAQRRMRAAKRIFMKFYRECVIELLKQCRDNWDSEKLIEITDEIGNHQEVSVTRDDLLDIDFEKDLKIEAESPSVNKDVVREQMISLYKLTQQDPLIDRRAMIKEVMRQGFDEQDPERFLVDEAVEPGMQLVNPETGEQFMIDEGGSLVSQQQMEEQPLSEGEGTSDELNDMASSQPNLSGSTMGKAY